MWLLTACDPCDCNACPPPSSQAVKLLLAKGADVNLPSPEGQRPVEAAALKGHTDLIKV